MTVTNFPGAITNTIGPGALPYGLNASVLTNTTLDAAAEACIMIGYMVTSDGASHTLDTTGSSSIQWRTGTSTFSNGSTTVKVGIAAVDLTAGPPARAVAVANVITFDVNASFTGGGGGITSAAWQTSVPTAGTKTIANGDFVAICIQMTARGGADSVNVANMGISNAANSPLVTNYVGAAYAGATVCANAIIRFSDGAYGWLYATEVSNTSQTARTFNNGSSPSEFGQLYQFAFPVRAVGLWMLVDPDADFDMVLYSDPLGTPVAEKTVSVDLNAVFGSTVRRLYIPFDSPYDVAANAVFATVVKPSSGSSMSAHYTTLANADHRVVFTGGTSSYGVSRSGGSGAFANANSSLDNYVIGPMLGGFDDGTGGGGVATPLFGGGVI